MARIKMTIEADNIDEFMRKFFAEIARYNGDTKTKTEIINIRLNCKECGAPAIEKKGINRHRKAYHGIFCIGNEKHVEWL